MQFVIHSWPVPQELLLLLHLDAPSVTEHEGMLGRSMPYKTQLLAMASNLIVIYCNGLQPNNDGHSRLLGRGQRFTLCDAFDSNLFLLSKARPSC